MASDHFQSSDVWCLRLPFAELLQYRKTNYSPTSLLGAGTMALIIPRLGDCEVVSSWLPWEPCRNVMLFIRSRNNRCQKKSWDYNGVLDAFSGESRGAADAVCISVQTQINWPHCLSMPLQMVFIWTYWWSCFQPRKTMRWRNMYVVRGLKTGGSLRSNLKEK